MMRVSRELYRRYLKPAGVRPMVAAARPVTRRGPKPRALVHPAAVVEFVAPVRVVSEANTRDHGLARHRRFREQAETLAATAALLGIDWRRVAPPVLVTLTRLGGRPLDDDNLAGAFKGVRDAIAGVLGVNDGDAAAAGWAYRQAPGGPEGIRVRVERRGW